jgi:hypothetical protein
MARTKEAPKKWYLLDGPMGVWTVLMTALLIFVAQGLGSYVGAMPARQGLDQQEVPGWVLNGGAGAGREVREFSRGPDISPGTMVDEHNGTELSGRRQDTKRMYNEETANARTFQERTYYYNGITRMYNEETANARTFQERTYYYNGITAPQAIAKKRSKLRRLRIAAKVTKIGVNYKRIISEALPRERRLDPDEPACRLCQRRMRTIKQLENHYRGMKHREVLESTQMNERRRDCNRDHPRRHERLVGEPGGTQQRPPRTIKHPGGGVYFPPEQQSE